MDQTNKNQRKILVWDLPLRLFHWLLVIALVAQWATAELADDMMDWHFYIGYFTLGLIVFRLLWGFFGPKHARFSSFLSSPKNTYSYFKHLLKREDKPFAGHNPLGGLIVPLVIIVVGLQAITGLFTGDDVLHFGPYYYSVSTELQETLSWLHHKNFDVITGIILVHILALIWHKLALKHKLVGAMFTGKKQGEEKDAISSSKIWVALAILVIIALGIFLLLAFAPEPPDEFYF